MYRTHFLWLLSELAVWRPTFSDFFYSMVLSHFVNYLTIFIIHISEHGHSHSHGHSHGDKESGHAHASHAKHTVTDDIPVQDSSSTVSARAGSYSSMYGYPAATRAAVSQAAQDIAIASPSSHQRNDSSSSCSIRMVPDGSVEINITETPRVDQRQDKIESSTMPPLPSGHSHSHGHSHGSMNMRALMLHVMGDALGNIGVIVTGLVIWLTNWSGRFYLDPAVSLVITVIIFTSALPLGKLPLTLF
jgi:zinc transporter 1